MSVCGRQAWHSTAGAGTEPVLKGASASQRQDAGPVELILSGTQWTPSRMGWGSWSLGQKSQVGGSGSPGGSDLTWLPQFPHRRPAF